MRPVRFATLVAVLWSTALSRPAAGQVPVDLTERPWTVKQGFAPRDAAGFDPAAGRPVAGFPVILNEIFDVPPGAGVRHYALQTTFDLPGPTAPGGGLYGVLFATIGEAWTVYLNGAPIASTHLDGHGPAAHRHSLRHVVLALPPSVARAGTNRLVVHLFGEAPATRFTENTALGFYQRKGYVVDELARIQVQRGDYTELFMLATFFLFTLYAAVLAWYRRQDRYHAAFALLCAVLVVYYASRSHRIFYYIHDTADVTRLEYTSVFAAGALIMWFMSAFLRPGAPMPAWMRAFAAWSAASAAAAAVVPFGYTDPLLRLWQITATAAALLLAWSVVRAAAARVPDAAQILPGLILLLASALWDIADSALLQTGLRVSPFAFTFFIASLAYVIAYRAIRKRSETIAQTFALREREARLGALFDASFEALVLHQHGTIRDVNPSFTRLFGYTLDEVRKLSVGDLFDGAPDLSPANGGPARREAKAVRKDGTRFHVEYLDRPWAWDGVTGEVLALRDIDAYKRAEAELRDRNAELEILVRSMSDREAKLRELEAQLKRRAN